MTWVPLKRWMLRPVLSMTLNCPYPDGQQVALNVFVADGRKS